MYREVAPAAVMKISDSINPIEIVRRYPVLDLPIVDASPLLYDGFFQIIFYFGIQWVTSRILKTALSLKAVCFYGISTLVEFN